MRHILATFVPRAAALAGLLALVPVPAQAQIECDCPTVGSYRDPAEPVPITTSPTGQSPGHNFTVSATGSGPINLQVRRVSDNTLMLSLSIPITSAWGFSPDDMRFLYHSLVAGVDNVVLYDLSGSPNPSPRWSTSVNTGSSRILFSPHGGYLMYTYLSGVSVTTLTVINVFTGTAAYTSSFAFTTAPGSGEDEYGVAGWGWSPDTQDRSFAYAFVSGANTEELLLANLANHTTIQDLTLTSISGFWQFSPCGDRFATALQDAPSHLLVDLWATSNGGHLGEQGAPLAAAALRSTALSQIVNIGGTDYVLAPNTAGSSCSAPPHLASLGIQPSTVAGGNGALGTIGLTDPPPTYGYVANLSSNDPVVTVPAQVPLATAAITDGFNITTGAVTSVHHVTITATMGSDQVQASLTVNPPPPPQFTYFYLDADNQVGGSARSIWAQFDKFVTSDQVVTLSSASPALAPVPPSLTVTTGNVAGSAYFTPPAVARDTSVLLTGTWGSIVKTTTLHIRGPRVVSLASRQWCFPGGTSDTLVLTIDGPAPAGGLPVPITVSDPAHLFAPAAVVVPAGQTSLVFGVTTPAVSAPTDEYLTATLNGSQAQEWVVVQPMPPWIVEDINPLGAAYEPYTEPGGMNVHGDVVGAVEFSNPWHGFLWKNGFFQWLNDFYWAYAINDNGDIVGQGLDGSAVGNMIVQHGATITDLGVGGVPWAINNAGQIAGGAYLPGHPYEHAFVATYLGGVSVTDLGTADDLQSEATAINHLGEIVGWMMDPHLWRVERPFKWTSGGGLVQLPILPGANRGVAWGVNDAGVIVGICSYDNGAGDVATMWVDDQPESLDVSPSAAVAINTVGQIVGSGPGGKPRMWSHGQAANLTFGNSSACEVPDGIFGINDAGQILAWTSLIVHDDGPHAVRITPTQVPTTVPPSGPAPPTKLAMTILGNPFHGVLGLRLALPRAESASLELIDTMGRRVASRDVANGVPGYRLIELRETSELPAGVYFLRARQAGSTVTQRVVLLR